MNNQPTVIVSNAPQAPTPHKKTNLSLILIVVLGLGTVVFGIASVAAFGKAHTATSTLESAKAAAASQAAATQKATDVQNNLLANESPYRTYLTPDTFGAFSISFPKNWNMSVDLSDSSSTQVDIRLHPEFLRSINGAQDLLGAEISLNRIQYSDYLLKFNAKKVSQTPATVAGIVGAKLTGTFQDGRTAQIIAIPVRDKTIVFKSEDPAYATEFQAIVSQAKINP